MYTEEDYLQLSGLQHFAFCRRQWALIHVENQWADNLRTVEGNLMHEKAHDSSLRESRGELYILRGISVHSSELGISGQCDVLEYHRGNTGIPLSGKEGLWQPYPVEYKKGSPKKNDADRLQLCAQAMALKKCCAAIFPKERCFTGKPDDVKSFSFLKNCAAQSVDIFLKCTTMRSGVTRHG